MERTLITHPRQSFRWHLIGLIAPIALVAAIALCLPAIARAESLHRIGAFGTPGPYLSPRYLCRPTGLDVGPDGKVHVGDRDMVHAFTAEGAPIGTDYIHLYGVGTWADATASDVAVDASGTIYVCDETGSKIWRVGATANTKVAVADNQGSADGQLSHPWHIACAPNGDIYVLDSGNSRIQYFASTGEYLGQWPWLGTRGIAVAPDGTVWSGSGVGVSHFSATGESLGSIETSLPPVDVAASPDGTLFVACTDGAENVLDHMSADGTRLSRMMLGQAPAGVAVAPNGAPYVTECTPPTVERFSAPGPSPATTIAGLPIGWVNHDVTFSLTASSTGIPVLGTHYGLSSASGQVIDYSEPVHIADDGVTTVSYWSEDGSGNVEATNTAEIRIDTAAPKTTCDATTTYGPGAVVHLTSSDGGSGVASVRYELDGVAGTYGEPLSVIGVGTHVLSFSAVDNVGNSEATNTISFELVPDITPPLTTAIHVIPHWYNMADYPTLIADDGATGWGVASTYFSLNDAPFSEYPGGSLYVSDEGTNTLRYWSVDKAGNVEATETTLVLLDYTPPTTTDNHVSTYTAQADIAFSASDALSGVAGTSHAEAGDRIDPSLHFRTIVPGAHTLGYWSYDNAGNVEGAHWIHFYVIAPTPGITRSPAASSVTYKRKGGTARFTLGAGLRDSRGALPAGVLVYLQKSTNGKTWSKRLTLRTDRKGRVAAKLTVKKKGAAYYRWSVPKSKYDAAAVSKRQKVVVK
jgi:hypothetical protein